MSDMGAIIRASGLIEQIQPPRVLQQQAIVGQVITPAGEIEQRVAASLATPVPLDWYYATISSGTQAQLKQVPRAGFVVRLGAHASTAPTSPCVIRLTVQSDGMGAVEVMTVTIAAGSNYGFSQISPGIEVNSMAWLGIYIVQTGSAAGVSITAVVQGGPS